MHKKCLICSFSKFKLIWNSPIRSSSKSFTKNKKKILQCLNCGLVFLKERNKLLENSSLARNLYNKSNSYQDFINFHKTRELKKINIIKKFVNFKNKSILESNSGTGVIINLLKNKAKVTAGLDDKFYKNYFRETNHLFFENIKSIEKNNIKFDIIFSLSEIEHKYNPIIFLKSLKKILSRNGSLVLRVPNYENIYSYLIGNDFYKYDFRTSHNFYFNRKNFTMLIEKLNFNIIHSFGYHEYSSNHLIEYIKKKKRIYSKNIKNYFNFNQDRYLVKNIEKSFLSTSMIFIVNNKRT